MMNRKAKVSNRIDRARASRDASIAKIHRIQESMERLINSSIDADDLERSINAMDYRLLRQELESEQENFDNLDRVLKQLQTDKLTEFRVAAAKETMRSRSKVDVDQLIAREDYLAAQSQVFREEDEKFRAIAADAVFTGSAVPMDLDFETLVARAAAKRGQKGSP